MDVDGSEVEVGVGAEAEVGVAPDNGVDDVKREKNEVKKRMRWGVVRRAAIIYRQPVSPDLRSISNPNSLKTETAAYSDASFAFAFWLWADNSDNSYH